MGKYLLKNSGTQEFRNSGHLKCPLFWIFEIQNSWLFDNWKLWILENHEKSKTRNLLTLISPAEFLEKLEYEFSFDQKYELIFVKTNHFLCSGKVIPITNQRTDSHPCIRFLHPMLLYPISAPLHPSPAPLQGSPSCILLPTFARNVTAAFGTKGAPIGR